MNIVTGSLRSTEGFHLIRLEYVAAFFLLLSWLVPNHYFPWPAFYSDTLAFLALLFLIGSVFKNPLFINGFTTFYLLSSLIIVVQLVFERYLFRSDALLTFVYLGSSFVAFMIGLSIIKMREFVVALAWLIFLGALTNSLIGICQWVGFGSIWTVEIHPGNRAVGNLGQYNNYATLNILGLLSLMSLHLQGRISKSFYQIAGVVLVVGLLISNSRTPFLQVVFVGGWLVFLAVKKEEKLGLLVFSPILLYLVTYFFFPTLKSMLLFSESEVRLLDASQYGSRINIWTSLLGSIQNSPLLGYGWGQVSVAQVQNLNIESVEFVEHSHNLLLDLMVWNGPILGLILFAILSFHYIRQMLAVGSHSEWYLVASVGAVLIHALLEYPLDYAYILLVFSLMLGLTDNLQGRRSALSFTSPFYKVGILFFGALLMAVYWREYRVLEQDHRLMRAQNYGLPVDKSLSLSDDIVLADSERDYIRFARMKAKPEMPVDELRFMEKVALRYPFAVVLYRYAVALGLNGEPARAEEILGKLKIYYGPEKYDYYHWYFLKSLEAGYEA